MLSPKLVDGEACWRHLYDGWHVVSLMNLNPRIPFLWLAVDLLHSTYRQQWCWFQPITNSVITVDYPNQPNQPFAFLCFFWKKTFGINGTAFCCWVPFLLPTNTTLWKHCFWPVTRFSASWRTIMESPEMRPEDYITFSVAIWATICLLANSVILLVIVLYFVSAQLWWYMFVMKQKIVSFFVPPGHFVVIVSFSVCTCPCSFCMKLWCIRYHISL